MQRIEIVVFGLVAATLLLTDDELDYADVIYRVGRAFKIRFSKQEYPHFTGSLGNLIEKT